MKVLLLSFLFCILSTSAVPRIRYKNPRPTNYCNATDCFLPDCYCSGTAIPGGIEKENTPQFVLLTFDDAVTVSNMEYYRDALYNRINPTGCPISATFFVAHEYTDYSLIHELNSKGHEISLHSITHKTDTTYWGKASVELLEQEFVDQRLMMSTFGAIEPEKIKGIRMPFLQMAGNNQFDMMSKNQFTYDLSWPTLKHVNPGMWPYTLKYQSTQDCPVGVCPVESYPNSWVIPMIAWANDVQNHSCSMIDACVNYLDKVRPDNTFEWMKGEFLKQYDGNRAPFGVYIHASWFNVDDARFEGYKKFLDYLTTLPDVYMVSASEVIDWIKNPRTIQEMTNTPCKAVFEPTCVPTSCPLKKDDGQFRYMISCVPCPSKYPWLGNPLGNNQEEFEVIYDDNLL